MNNMRTKKRITNILTYFFLVFWFLCIALVLYVTIVNSFKTQVESSKSFLTLPEAFQLDNYIAVFQRSGFVQAVGNTIFFTLISIIIVAVFVPAVSYAVNQMIDLKANQQFIALSDELAGTENRIAVARKDYNDAVKNYNQKIRRFPSNIFANLLGFEKAEYFQAAEGAQQVPEVNFEGQ